MNGNSPEDPGEEEPRSVTRDREQEVGRGGQEACSEDSWHQNRNEGEIEAEGGRRVIDKTATSAIFVLRQRERSDENAPAMYTIEKTNVQRPTKSKKRIRSLWEPRDARWARDEDQVSLRGTSLSPDRLGRNVPVRVVRVGVLVVVLRGAHIVRQTRCKGARPPRSDDARNGRRRHCDGPTHLSDESGGDTPLDQREDGEEREGHNVAALLLVVPSCVE